MAESQIAEVQQALDAYRSHRDGGRLVLPLGSPFGYQNLVLLTKRGEDVSVKQVTGVLFVPMTGHAMQKGRP